ncbi:MAG: replication initiation protein [Candidatus Brocadiales bacterium]|nr:replication initiation protein [Candidatus Brocadiales bacterium]
MNSLERTIRKPTPLIHFRRKMSPIEQKLVTLIAYHVRNVLPDDRGFYYLKINFVKAAVGWGNNHGYPAVIAAFESLFDNSIEWNFLEEDSEFGRLSVHLITKLLTPKNSGVKGRVGFKIEEDIENLIKGEDDKLAQLKFVMMSLLTKPIHAYAMYELLANSYSLGNNNIKISLPDFKEYLGYSKDSYPVFKDFKIRVLKPNIDAVNSNSDFYVKYDTYRDGRKIGGLIFTIKKQSWQIPLPINENGKLLDKRLLQYDEENSGKKIKSQKLLSKEEESFIQSVSIFKINRKNAIEAIKKHGLKSAIEARNCALHQIESKKNTNDPVRSPGAYVARFLIDGLGMETNETKAENARLAAEKKEEQEKEHNKKVLNKIESYIDQERKKKLRKLTASLSNKQDSKFKEEFLNEIECGKYKNDLLTAFNSGGWKAVELTYKHTFLPSKLLSPSEDDYRNYAKSIGHDYDNLIASQ